MGNHHNVRGENGMRMIYVAKKADVRKKTWGIHVREITDEIFEAVDALKSFAIGSIYDDTSEGYCYEDNISFFSEEKRDLIKTLKFLKHDIEGYIAELEKIEPYL